MAVYLQICATLHADENGPVFFVGSDADDMPLHRAFSTEVSGCPTSLNVHTPQLDGGNIYGTSTSYLDATLRAPGSCFMRVSTGNHLPLTTKADGSGKFHFIAGDVRVAEHSFLSAQHTVWPAAACILPTFAQPCSMTATLATVKTQKCPSGPDFREWLPFPSWGSVAVRIAASAQHICTAGVAS